ncbi:hypothetical protein DFQ28_011069 [Apophysomyces sp. BC1034]|nr:hypothetical protein DFQ30_010802 [Apophysomyces sp. BC1015]KAG0184487.1 hypothetical protein DFQ28_011069 [Apophysomyces sp. BC1034]
MTVNVRSLTKWSLLGLLLALLLRNDPLAKKTLLSLRENPSEYYTLDFFPNGTDLQLPMGTMRYWNFGDPNGKRVVLIHGISTGSASYEKLARSLADQGHNVLLFDLWGRGFADAPPGYYDESLYNTQITLVLQTLGWESTDIVGVSLGGGIATSFTALYPEKVNKLVLIAPAGLMQSSDLPLMGKLVKLPLISNIILHPFVKPLATLGVTRFASSIRLAEKTDLTERLSKIALHQFTHHPGFYRAFFGTVMDFPLHGLHERYQKVGQEQDRQVLVLWGDKDTTVPYRCHSLLSTYIPHAIVKRYEGGGHDILISNWERVNREIGEFLA